MAGNLFVYVPMPLEGAVALEYLRLDNNPIKVIDRVNGFPNLTRLKEVSLCYMQSLTAIENGGLSTLVSLESLYVQNCPKLKKINEYAIALEVICTSILNVVRLGDLRSRRLHVESRCNNHDDS